MRRLIVASLFLPLNIFAQLSVTPVQTAKNDTGAATGTTFTVTMGSTPTQGNCLIAAVVVGSSSAIKATSTNTRWINVSNVAYNVTGAVQPCILVGYPDASAGTVITISVVAGGGAAMAAVVSEFSGSVLTSDSISVAATGSSTSASVTIGASNHGNALLIACEAVRGTFSAQTTVFSAPTNSFSLIDQRNTTINTSNADRCVALLAKVITDGASVSAGTTVTPTAQWAATGVSFAEVKRGFFITKNK